jgi:septal ring-binding cell division protein DamX
MNSRNTTTYFLSEGDVPGQYRVSNQNLFYVVKQTWSGGRIVNTETVGSYATEAEARAALDKLRKGK